MGAVLAEKMKGLMIQLNFRLRAAQAQAQVRLGEPSTLVLIQRNWPSCKSIITMPAKSDKSSGSLLSMKLSCRRSTRLQKRGVSCRFARATARAVNALQVPDMPVG